MQIPNQFQFIAIKGLQWQTTLQYIYIHMRENCVNYLENGYTIFNTYLCEMENGNIHQFQYTCEMHNIQSDIGDTQFVAIQLMFGCMISLSICLVYIIDLVCRLVFIKLQPLARTCSLAPLFTLFLNYSCLKIHKYKLYFSNQLVFFYCLLFNPNAHTARQVPRFTPNSMLNISSYMFHPKFHAQRQLPLTRQLPQTPTPINTNSH